MPTPNFCVPVSSSERLLAQKERLGLQSDLRLALWSRVLLKKMGSRSRMIGRGKEGLLPIFKDPGRNFCSENGVYRLVWKEGWACDEV